MEYNSIKSEKRGSRAWLVVLLSALAGVAALILPHALLIVPALWAYAGARYRPWMLVLAAIPFAGSAFFLYRPIPAAGLVLAAVGGAAALLMLQKRRLGNTYTVLALAGVCLIGLYAALCLPGVLSGAGAFADMQAAIDEALALYRTAIPQMQGLNTETAKAALAALDMVSASVPDYVVAALCVMAGALGLSNLLFFRLFCRKHPQIGLAPMRAFRLWSIPRSIVLGLLAMLAGAMLLEWSGWSYAAALSNTISALSMMPLTLQGLCVLDFFLARGRRSAARARGFTYAALGLIFCYKPLLVVAPLALLGCFEQFARLRERSAGVPPRLSI